MDQSRLYEYELQWWDNGWQSHSHYGSHKAGIDAMELAFKDHPIWNWRIVLILAYQKRA